MTVFVLGVILGFVIGFAVRSVMPYIAFWWMVNEASKRRKQEIKDGIEQLERHVNAQDWNDDD